ncbi:hypothetical protein Scep_003665 [Stephania cephalantha]|uniref:EF-hand domain-containing protein n=1 Tax=Stephania cephalantha TaxID=152367 RepID=A0AAP0PY97_9MAGN
MAMAMAMAYPTALFTQARHSVFGECESLNDDVGRINGSILRGQRHCVQKSRGRPVRGARAEPGRGAVPVELRNAFESLRLLETHFGIDDATPPEELTRLYVSIIEQFDGDHNGTVDPEEFRSGMKQVLLAITNALVSSPIQMVIDDDDQSILKAAADYKASKVEQQRS